MLCCGSVLRGGGAVNEYVVRVSAEVGEMFWYVLSGGPVCLLLVYTKPVVGMVVLCDICCTKSWFLYLSTSSSSLVFSLSYAIRWSCNCLC